MLYLRQSTASQEVLLGPFVDDTDGKTAETGLTIANTDIKLWFEGGTSESSKNSGGATHIASGRYYAVLDATDTATVGKLEINVAVSGALPVRREFMVLEEAIYDALFASSATGAFTGVTLAADQAVNVTKFGGTTVTGRDIGASVLLSSGTGTGQISLSSGQVTFGNTSIATVTNLTNLPSIPAGWLTASGIAASALNGKGDWNIGKTGYTVSTVSDKTGYSLSGTQTFNVTGNITGNLTGSVGSVTGAVGSVTGNVGGNVAGSVGSVTGAVGSVTGLTASDVGAIKTKTDFLPSATAGASGGLLIAGSNAATTVASLTVTTDFAIGNAFSMTSFSLDGTAPLPSSTAGSPSGLAIVGSKVDLVDTPNATAITAIQSGLSTLTASQVWANGTRTLTAQADAVLATSQPNYAPAKAGDAMTLTSAYDAAKTALTTLGTNAPAGWINAAAIAANALNGKGDWNVGKTGYTVSTVSDKTGYSLTQTFPTNFSSLAITVGGAVTAGTVSDKTGYALTQTFPSNFSSLGISAGGKINGVVLTDTLTTYTGNTLQTGDAYARIGAAGAGLTALGDTRIANLDAAVTTRMASYTQPTGFLAATFPTTVASPTNITAGTIASVTGAVGSVTGSVGSVVGAVGSVTGLTASDVGAIKTKTDFLPSALAGAAGGLLIAGSNAPLDFAGFSINGFNAGELGGPALVGSQMALSTTQGGVTFTGLTIDDGDGGGNFTVNGTFSATEFQQDGVGFATIIATAVWNALTSGLTTVGSIGKWILDNLDVAVSTVSGSGSGSGSGANPVTVTVVDDDTSAAIGFATVRLGTFISTANSSGAATFSLDDANYVRSATDPASAYTFTPDAITVDATHTTFEVRMTAKPAPPIPSAGQCTGTLRVVDGSGAPDPNVTITFEAYRHGSSGGFAYDSTAEYNVSDTQGVISRAFPSGGVTYRYRRGPTGPWTIFTTAANDGDTFTIPSSVGTP